MSDNNENRIYKWGFAPGTENVAKKFGMVEEPIRKENISIQDSNSEEKVSQIEEILTGWGNLVKSHFMELDSDLKAQSQSRLEICNGCDMRNWGTCSTQREGRHVVTGEMVRGCGCRLAAKALSPKSSCPLGKW
jgi:hypothetical protein